MLKKILIGAFIPIFLITGGLGCKTQSQAVVEATKPIELVWWRVFDGTDTIGPLIQKYNAIHPNIGIIYRKLRPEEYEKELLDALAEDRGPDIFTIHNTDMLKYQSKLTPMPAEITMPYLVTTGTVKKETTVELRKEKTMRFDQLRNLYLDVVADDVVLPHRTQDGAISNKIFGLPLAIDTMVLYANRDLLNSAGIAEPATTWEQFLDQVTKLTKLSAKGDLLQSGVALGTSENVERATDILSVLMMQNGAVMTQNGGIYFNQIPAGSDRTEPPGAQALRFYTDFANPTKEAYTWNADMPNSLDSFVAGTSAYFFGYAYHLPTIKARAPKLNLVVSGLPQIDPASPTNFANYWIEGVSAKSTHVGEAWDFVQFITRRENVGAYLSLAKKPTALRALIQTQSENEDMTVFASQLLTSKSWYKGKDWSAAETALKEMINTVLNGEKIPLEAINLGAARVAQTIQ